VSDPHWAGRAAPTEPDRAWSWEQAVASLAAGDGVPTTAAEQVRTRLEGLAVPPGSLGRLGDVLIGIATATGTIPGSPQRATLIVAAGDHGLHAHGVSPWPQAISGAVAGAIARGDAAAGVLARTSDTRVVVLDAALAAPTTPHPRLLARAVRRGTRDALGPGGALTPAETAQAMATGAGLTHALVDEGTDLLLLGDVGIANTTASAALIATLLDVAAPEVTGRGSGIDDATLTRKREVVTRLVERFVGRPVIDVLAGIGGAEHAATVGVLLAAAERRIPVVLDGVISAACAVVATALSPSVRPLCIAGHRSPEPAASVALDALGISPLLDLRLRVGEGTGALLALPVLRSAWAVLEETITLAGLNPPDAG
jgi:nicotinate-nucleotide--dimethylbenzimidazole phosphoribosyltransferase